MAAPLLLDKEGDLLEEAEPGADLTVREDTRGGLVCPLPGKWWELQGRKGSKEFRFPIPMPWGSWGVPWGGAGEVLQPPAPGDHWVH